MKSLRLLAAAALSMIAVGAASAQTAPDPALLETVSAAFSATQAAQSMHIATQTFVESNRGGDDAGVSSQSVSAFDAAAAAGGWNVAGTQTTTTAVADGAQELTTELIVVDGVTYMRTADAEWMTLGGAPDAAQTDAAPTLNTTQATRVLGALLLPADANAITAISALPADTIDDQAMNVFQVTLDSQAVIDSDASALLSGGGGGMMRGGMPGGAAPDGAAPDGATPPDGQQPPDMQATPGALPEGGQPPADGTMPQGGFGGMRDLAAEDVAVTFAVYIGVDDGLIHRIYSVIDVASSGDQAGSFSQRTTSIMDLSAFGAPVTITAPEVSA